MNTSTAQPQRLESLDILRGADLFCLVGLEAVIHALSAATDSSWFAPVSRAFTHVEWAGFSPWDLVMPLFMFMTGITIPFSLSRYRSAPWNRQVWARILKRVILLWLFGMMCQGNLLALDPSHVYLYTNTLQAIAAGYLISALIYLHCRRSSVRIAVTLLLMAIYCVGMHLCGDFTPDGNFAESIDRECLGRFRDMAATSADGSVIFHPHYRYTWVWSTLTFAVTVMSGVFAGTLLRQAHITSLRKALIMALTGAALAAIGWMWHPWHPVIKRLWTASMVLVSSGYCFMLMAGAYCVGDCIGIRRPFAWLKIYGMNSIAAYMIMSCVDFSSLSRSLLFGLQQFTDAYYPAVIAIANATITYIILLILYRHRIFLKV